MPIEELKEVLSKNKNLSDEVKNNLLSLCKIFIEEFPNVPLVYLKNNLSTLKIEKVSKYVIFSGFNENNFLKAFNIGFTEIITNNLVGNEGEILYYDDEVVATNLLASIIGFDKMLDAYFNNNASIVINSLMEAGEDNI